MPWEPHLGAQPLEVLEEEGDREGDASDEDAADLERALLVVAKGLGLLGLALGRRRRVGASRDGGDGIVVRQRHARGRGQRKGAGTEEGEGVPAADAGVGGHGRARLGRRRREKSGRGQKGSEHGELGELLCTSLFLFWNAWFGLQPSRGLRLALQGPPPPPRRHHTHARLPVPGSHIGREGRAHIAPRRLQVSR